MANRINGAARSANLALFACLMAATVVAIAAMSPALLFLLDPARPTPFSGGIGRSRAVCDRIRSLQTSFFRPLL